MTKSDIELLEKEFQIKLPADYQHYLLNYPIELNKQANANPHTIELINDLQQLIEENKDAAEVFGKVQADGSFVWQKNYFLIGFDESVGFYFLDLDQNPSPVYCFDFEMDESSEFMPTIDEYIKFVIE
jgi:SMI1 / KNR4 family (SUKH-1)